MNHLSDIRLAVVYNWRKRSNSIIDKPIHIRATQNNKTVYLPTGVRISPSQWNGTRIIKHPLSDILNKKINDQLFEIESYILEMTRRQKGSVIPVSQIKDYQNIDNNHFKTFNEFCKYEVENADIEYSTRRSHKSKLNKFFRDFRKGKPVYFRELTVSVIKQFDRFIKSLKVVNSQNTVHGYHKTLKTYINKAIVEGLVKENPYDKFKVKKEREENIKREWLTLEEMQRIEKLSFGEGQEHLKTIKQFFLICLWCGFRFSTTVSLLPTDIRQTKDGISILKLKIAKTNKRVFMPLYLLGEKGKDGLTKPERLLKKLLAQRAKDTNGQAADFKDLPLFAFSLQHINRELKTLAKLANIDKNITTHCGRRTFVNVMAKDFGLPIQ